MHPVMTEKLAAEQIREMIARVTPPGAPAAATVRVIGSGPGAAGQLRTAGELRAAGRRPGPRRPGRPGR